MNMSLFKCKMCGGDLEIVQGVTIAECEYCGTKQTVPKAMDENLQNLFNRANMLRIKSEFDKAEKLYEKILQADATQSDAYWGLILCKYGIEYVDDPVTFKKIPTCHRASYDSIIADDDYKLAIENADMSQRAIYEEQAREIDRIQKDILALAQKEETYDVFICYKETDANGQRTQDSVIANDIYYQLAQEGFKVFYAAITLEGKLGSAYEPIIFAALNSAKVMLSIGTKPEYFNAVWVKNEWSRFLKIIKKDRSKLLIPCYRDMDAYELPEEFAHLQAQDMAKIGFINDLVRGIKKVLAVEKKPETATGKVVMQQASVSTVPLLKRAFMFLEDGDWNSANEYCEKVLDIEPENAQAYLGKLMAELKVKKQEELKDCAEPFDGKNNYQKALRFADEVLKESLVGYIEHIKTRNENARMVGIYSRAKKAASVANTVSAYKEAARLFESVGDYQDADALAKECYKNAEIARKNAVLSEGKAKMSGMLISRYEAAIELFESIPGWGDADACILECKNKIEQINAKAEADRVEKARVAKRNKKIAIIFASIVCVIVVFIILLNTVIIPLVNYNHGKALLDKGDFAEAYKIFIELGDYKDSEQMLENCAIGMLDDRYNAALALMQKGKYEEAFAEFHSLSDYKDSAEKMKECEDAILAGECEEQYQNAIALMEAKKYTEAIEAFEKLSGYKDSAEKIAECNNLINEEQYQDAVALMEAKKYTEAIEAFEKLSGYKDSAEKIAECEKAIQQQNEAKLASQYNSAKQLMDQGKTAKAAIAFGKLGSYKDSKSISKSLWNQFMARDTISAGSNHTVGLKADGTVVAVGDNDYGQCNVSDWKDIVAISAGSSHTVGLKADGTVVAVGSNYFGQCNVSDWKGIVAISAGFCHTVGLKADGTVVALGNNDDGQCKVSGWKDIVAISAGSDHTAGLKADGTVVAVGDNDDGQCKVSGWKDIVAISAGYYHTVGLKADGTVVAVGDNDDGQCKVSGWKDIVAISADFSLTVGLKADGSAVAVGYNYSGQCNVSDWKGIVAISAGSHHTVGLKMDGTVSAVGENDDGQCNVSNWENIKIPDISS